MIRGVLGSRASIGGVLGSGRGGAAAWYLAGGTIAEAAVKEWVENPAKGQLYAGGTITGTWTVAFRTAWSGTNGQYALDVYFAPTNRLIHGVDGAGNQSFSCEAGWIGPGLFVSGVTHTYFFVVDSGNVTIYRNNVSFATTTTAREIKGSIRWRSNATSATVSNWLNEIPKGAVYNIALNSTQRSALYSSMAA